MSRVFLLPDLGEGLQEAEIIDWHVKPGDRVVVDDVLVSVETAKAVVDVPSPYAGIIEILHGEIGDMMPVGKPLVTFSGSDVSRPEALPQHATQDSASRDAGSQDAGSVVGQLQFADMVSDEHFLVGREREPVPASPAGASGMRRLVQELQQDLGHVMAVSTEDQSAKPVVQTASSQPVLKPAEPVASAPVWQPLSGVRREMARVMARAQAEVCLVTVHEEADLHHWHEKEKIMPRLLRALVRAVEQEPALNAWYDAEKQVRQLLPDIHVGIAVDDPQGLFVPVLRHAQKLEQKGFVQALSALKRGVREHALAPSDFAGATISVSNFGSIGGLFATPVVVPPQVAILGAGRCVERLVMKKHQQIVSRRFLPLSLSFDHRAVTGGEATRFLMAVITDLSLAE